MRPSLNAVAVPGRVGTCMEGCSVDLIFLTLGTDHLFFWWGLGFSNSFLDKVKPLLFFVTIKRLFTIAFSLFVRV